MNISMFQKRSLAILTMISIVATVVTVTSDFSEGIKILSNEETDAVPIKTVYRPVPTNDLMCMAENIYYEAGIESYKGKLAVGQVVLNRVKSSKYPASICDVVFQGSFDAVRKPKGCQFSWTCQDGLSPIHKNSIAWDDSLRAAIELLSGKRYPDYTDGATHYHAHYVDPSWNQRLLKTVKIDTHIFYKYHTKS